MKKERQPILYTIFILVCFLTSSLLILSAALPVFSLPAYAASESASGIVQEQSSAQQSSAESAEQVIFIDTSADSADSDDLAGSAAETYTETYLESSNQIVGLIVTPSSNAYENFRATASHASFNVCTCDSFKDSLRVSNLGTVTTNYNLMKAGTASKFVNHIPAYFTLAPGQSQDIEMFGSVPCSSESIGSYELETYFKAVSGMTQVLKQPLNIKSCNSFDMHLVYPSFKNYPCTTTMYELKLYNREDFADTYKLSIPDLNPKYYTFSESYVLLAPYEEKSVFVYLNLPCSSSSSYKFNLKASSMQSEQEKTLPLYITIDKKGYNFQLELGEEKKLANATTTDSSVIIFKSAKDKQVKACTGDVYSVPVKLTNFAEFTNTFYISSNDDSIKTPKVVTLNKGQSILLSNYFNAAESSVGNHTYSIKALSDKGRLATELKFNVEVSGCGAKQNAAKTTIGKAAKALTLFFLLFLILLLVLLLLFYFMTSKKPSLYDELKSEQDSEEMLEKEAAKQASKQAAAAEQVAKPEELSETKRWWLIPLIILLALILLVAVIVIVGTCKDCHFGVSGNETQDIKTQDIESGTESSTVETPTEELVTEAVEKPAEAEQAEVEDEEQGQEVKEEVQEVSEPETTASETESLSFWQKIKAWFAAGPISATEISDATQASNISEQSDEEKEAQEGEAAEEKEQEAESEAVKEEPSEEKAPVESEQLEVVEPSEDEPSEIPSALQTNVSIEELEPSIQTNLTEPLPTQEMQPIVPVTPVTYADPRANMTQEEIDFLYQYLAEDEIKAINLSKYFIDVDGDKLVYSNNDALNVDIDYGEDNGEIAYIIPHRDWSGESSVVFKAEDGKGGYAYSPEIAIVVRPQNEFIQWMKKYKLYLIIAAAVVALLLLALLIYGIYKWRSPKQILIRKKAAKK